MRKTNINGFTIVELLVVIVVIAILAAISTIAFNGIRERAQTASVQASLSQATDQLALYAVENTGYPANLAAFTALLGQNANVQYQYSVNSSLPAGYCVTATIDRTAYFTAHEFLSGGTRINQQTPAKGTCPGHTAATGGGPATPTVVNLAPNPGIETDTASYTAANGASIARSTTRSQTGSSSLQVTLPVNTAAYIPGIILFTGSIGSSETLKPSTTYTISSYVYIPAGTPDVLLNVGSSGRASVTNDPAKRATSVKDSWVRIENTFTTTSSGGPVQVFLVTSAPTGSSTTRFWVDSVMVSEGQPAAPFQE